MLTADDLVILAKLRDSAEGEIVRVGQIAYIGYEEIPSRVVDKFVSMTAIRNVSEGEVTETFVLTSTGKQILFNPDIQNTLISALAQPSL